MINIWLLLSWPLLPGHRENCGSCLNLVSLPDFLSLRWMELSLSRKEKMAEYRYLFIRNIVCISICNQLACDSNKCVFGKKCIVYLILSRSLSNGNNSKAARTGQRARHWQGRKQKYIGKGPKRPIGRPRVWLVLHELIVVIKALSWPKKMSKLVGYGQT